MPLEKLNFFDDYERIRTPVEAFDAGNDYARAVSELLAACKSHRFLGVSPENLKGSGMPPAIVVRDTERRYIVMLDPKVESSAGQVKCMEACGNFFLMHDGACIHPAIETVRPRRLSVSYILSDGSQKKRIFAGRPFGRHQAGAAAVVMHEIDHTKGKTIVDIARDSLARGLRVVARIKENIGTKEIPDRACAESLTTFVRALMPFVLVRDGGVYRCYRGQEFEGQEPPVVSPDAVFMDVFFSSVSEIQKKRVPREGELISIVPSKTTLSTTRV